MKVRFERLTPSREGPFRLVPNQNRSAVPDLPPVTSVDVAKIAPLDRDLKVRRLSDREIHPVVVEFEPADKPLPRGAQLVVRYDSKLFSVLDQSGKPYPARKPTSTAPMSEDVVEAVIPLDGALAMGSKMGDLTVHLEARTFATSPRIDEHSPKGVTFTLQDKNGATLAQMDAIGGRPLDTAKFVLVGDSAPPKLLLICELPENVPSVIEVREAACKAGVPMAAIPKGLSLGDAWIQDQIQIGLALGAGQPMPFVLHLPRVLAMGAMAPQSPNLRRFVEAYFPAREMGLYNDAWENLIVIDDGATRVEMPMEEQFRLYLDFTRVASLYAVGRALLRKIDKKAEAALRAIRADDLFAIRLAVKPLRATLKTAAAAAPASVMTADLKQKIKLFEAGVDTIDSEWSFLMGTLIELKDDLQLKLKMPPKSNPNAWSAQFVFAAPPPADRPAPDASGPANAAAPALSAKQLGQLFEALAKNHDSRNYGGNIEVSPPMQGLPYGKILTGTIVSPDVAAMLAACAPLQPAVDVYTDFLKVGHVDEIMCFLPDPQTRPGFSIGRIAPRLAVTMLRRLQELQAEGKLVTRLFRGKTWIYAVAGETGGGKKPPHLYEQLMTAPEYDLTKIKIDDENGKGVWGHAALHDDRRFLTIPTRVPVDTRCAAFVTCSDMVRFLEATNRSLEDFFITGVLRFADDVRYAAYATGKAYTGIDRETGARGPGVRDKVLDRVLGRAFPGVPIYELPGLFDSGDVLRVRSSVAVTPNPANLQALGDHVLVGRPYGPRMRPADAVAFVRYMADGGPARLASYVRSALTEAWIRAEGLDVTHHWTRAGQSVAVAAASRRPLSLDDDFAQNFIVSDYQSYLDNIDPAPTPDFHTKLAVRCAAVPEDLAMIAEWFKDGFDAFKNAPVAFCEGDTGAAHPKLDAHDAALEQVKDAIAKANPGVFAADGSVIPREWTRIVIPENTVDVFQLYTHLVLKMCGRQVSWADSWYYHLLDGGLHCGTNVLRG